MFITDCATLNHLNHDFEYYVTMNDYCIFECKADGKETVYFKLDKTPTSLTEEERKKVLDSVLGVDNYGIEEVVTTGDLFMQGDYVTLIS